MGRSSLESVSFCSYVECFAGEHNGYSIQTGIQPALDLMHVFNADKLNMMEDFSLRSARCRRQCGIRGTDA
jgi:hypothetical protein